MTGNGIGIRPITLATLVLFTLVSPQLGSAKPVSIDRVDVFPTCAITSWDRVVLEVEIVTNTTPAFLLRPTEVTRVGRRIDVRIYAASGPLAAKDFRIVTVDLGRLPTGTYDYLVGLNCRDGGDECNVEGSLTVVRTDCPRPDPPARLYWADGRETLKRAWQDGSKVENIGPKGLTPKDLGTIESFLVDRQDHRMYWSEFAFTGAGRIVRSTLTGSLIEEVLNTGVQRTARGLILHAAAGQLYYTVTDTTDSLRDGIYRANKDGSGVEELVSGLRSARDLRLDTGHGKMFWTVRVGSSGSSYKIQSANLDGSDRADVVTGLRFRSALTLDPQGKKMYWAAGTTTIQRADYNGTNIETVIELDGTRAHNILIDDSSRKLYWNNRNGIKRSNLDGTAAETVVAPPSGLLLLDRITLKMYWIESGRLWRSDLDGLDREVLFEDLIWPFSPLGLTVVSESVTIPTVGGWGFLILALSLAAGGMIYNRHAHRTDSVPRR